MKTEGMFDECGRKVGFSDTLNWGVQSSGYKFAKKRPSICRNMINSDLKKFKKTVF